MSALPKRIQTVMKNIFRKMKAYSTKAIELTTNVEEKKALREQLSVIKKAMDSKAGNETIISMLDKVSEMQKNLDTDFTKEMKQITKRSTESTGSDMFNNIKKEVAKFKRGKTKAKVDTKQKTEKKTKQEPKKAPVISEKDWKGDRDTKEDNYSFIDPITGKTISGKVVKENGERVVVEHYDPWMQKTKTTVFNTKTGMAESAVSQRHKQLAKATYGKGQKTKIEQNEVIISHENMMNMFDDSIEEFSELDGFEFDMQEELNDAHLEKQTSKELQDNANSSIENENKVIQNNEDC